MPKVREIPGTQGAPLDLDMLKTLPGSANTAQHPFPTLNRALTFDVALRIFPENAKIVSLGTGGPSHQLDTRRADFIDKRFDHWCLEIKAGAQGTERLMGMVMRDAPGDDVTGVTRSCQA